jgi:glycosyltransferase involved in cell wall biosynthesis
MRVSQVLCAAGPVDAVTNQAFAWRAKFDSWGWEGADYSAHIAPGVPHGVLQPLRQLEPRNGDVVLLHYSGYAAGLERLLAAAPRTLLVSHNDTPPRYFWASEPVNAAVCELGREQLSELAATAGALAGVSEFNARELEQMSGRPAEVIPILLDRSALPPAGPEPAGPPTILFVGRLVPHKRQDLLIRAFARYRRAAPDARLVLVGSPVSDEFEAGLRDLANRIAPGGVTFESGISRERLASRYAQAHVFLCLSEHEGFCIPLLEALHFGVPVIARDAGAIAEVLGDAGVLLGPEDRIATVAELLRIVVGDRELRAELQARGQRRLEHYDSERTAARLRRALGALAAS